MTRKIIKNLALALLAVFALGASTEAAAPKKVRHRTKHSTRVSSGTTGTIKKKPTKKRVPAKKTITRKPTARRHPSTKPR